MTRASPLRNFDYSVIEDILGEGTRMMYHPYLERKNQWGLWNPQEALVQINPLLFRRQNWEFENVIILHEWLHAYSDLILDVPDRRFREKQVDWWAHYHYRTDPYLATYIRSFFRCEGFWIEGLEKIQFKTR